LKENKEEEEEEEIAAGGQTLKYKEVMCLRVHVWENSSTEWFSKYLHFKMDLAKIETWISTTTSLTAKVDLLERKLAIERLTCNTAPFYSHLTVIFTTAALGIDAVGPKQMQIYLLTLKCFVVCLIWAIVLVAGCLLDMQSVVLIKVDSATFPENKTRCRQKKCIYYAFVTAQRNNINNNIWETESLTSPCKF
jgi:hypothetical protein